MPGELLTNGCGCCGSSPSLCSPKLNNGWQISFDRLLLSYQFLPGNPFSGRITVSFSFAGLKNGVFRSGAFTKVLSPALSPVRHSGTVRPASSSTINRTVKDFFFFPSPSYSVSSPTVTGTFTSAELTEAGMDPADFRMLIAPGSGLSDDTLQPISGMPFRNVLSATSSAGGVWGSPMVPFVNVETPQFTPWFAYLLKYQEFVSLAFGAHSWNGNTPEFFLDNESSPWRIHRFRRDNSLNWAAPLSGVASFPWIFVTPIFSVLSSVSGVTLAGDYPAYWFDAAASDMGFITSCGSNQFHGTGLASGEEIPSSISVRVTNITASYPAPILGPGYVIATPRTELDNAVASLSQSTPCQCASNTGFSASYLGYLSGREVGVAFNVVLVTGNDPARYSHYLAGTGEFSGQGPGSPSLWYSKITWRFGYVFQIVFSTGVAKVKTGFQTADVLGSVIGGPLADLVVQPNGDLRVPDVNWCASMFDHLTNNHAFRFVTRLGGASPTVTSPSLGNVVIDNNSGSGLDHTWAASGGPTLVWNVRSQLNALGSRLVVDA